MVTSDDGSDTERIMKFCRPPSTAKGTPSTNMAPKPEATRFISSSMVVTWSMSVKPSTSSRMRAMSASGV